MLTRKCDICGAEMRIKTPRYKVTYDGWLYTEEVDICMDCFERIAEEIKQADAPQTDAEITEFAKEIVHKMIDNSDIAEDAYPDLRQRMHEAVERLDEYYPSEDERSE